MASLGSSPFVIDSQAECPLLRPRLSFFTYRSKKSVKSSSLNALATGSSRPINIVEYENDHCSCSNNRLFGSAEFCKGKILRVRRLKAVGKDFLEGQDGEEIEDSFQASVEKSKRVLAMQRDLLHQIVERRKLVSSIKYTATEPAEAEISYQDRSGTQSNMNSASAIDNKTTDLTKDHSIIEQCSTAGIELHDGKKEPIHARPSKAIPSNVVSSKVSYSGVSKTVLTDEQPSVHSNTSEAQIAKNIKDELPPFVSSIEAPSLKDVKNDSEKSSTQKVKEVTVDSISKNENPPPLAGENIMNVILIAAECSPWIKTGGLGDVAGSLPKALARRGHRVMVVVPRYGNYAEPQDTGVRKMYKVDGQDVEVTYFQAYIDGVDFVFLDCSMFRHIENNIYGGNRVDILKRMVLLCKAAVEVPWHVPCGGVCYGDGNLVFIANDWHTALLPIYLKAYYRDNGLMKFTRSVLVIHNIAHQGRGPVDDFRYLDLPEHYIDLFKLYDPVGGEHFNIFAAALKTADRVVTVSHGYAWELKTSEGGWGLHNIINEIDWKFRGIVNGIDTKDWSPTSDIHLTSDGYTNYFLDTLQTGKAQCKEALQKELGLPVRDNVPLIGFIGRLDHQKGVDLIAEAIPWMMGQDVQLVMLGTGRQDLEQMLRQFEGQHRDKIRSWVGFSVKMAHRITAGADILLMPSRFEPCGLNQLYAMNYGTVPVVHAVGGLRDTVQAFDPFSDTGRGWTFDSAETNKLINALGYCLLTYREHKKSWEGLQRRGMSQDLSWDNAAKNYEEVLVAAKYQW